MIKNTAFSVPINQLVYQYKGQSYYCTGLSFTYDVEGLPSGIESRRAYGVVGDAVKGDVTANWKAFELYLSAFVLNRINGTACFNRAEMVRLYKERPDGLVIFNDELYRAIIAVESLGEDLVTELMEFTKIKLDLLEIVPAQTKNTATKKMEAQKKLQSIVRHAKGLLNAKRS